MLVEDNNINRGEKTDSVTILLLYGEIDMLLSGHVLSGCNMYRRGTRVRIGQGSVSGASVAQNGLLFVELTKQDLDIMRVPAGEQRRELLLSVGAKVSAVVIAPCSKYFPSPSS
jgi:hypothetical protein